MGAGEGGRSAEVGIVVLKSDVFGRIELGTTDSGPIVRRVASGSRVPGSAWIARVLAARERRALLALRGLDGVPQLLASTSDARTLERSFLDGEPLSRARALPRDFFEHLARLVGACHALGVCHNDLHKEQNVLVRPDGRPALVDFQLASIHGSSDRRFRTRCREDLRHVEKHRQRYVRQGRSRAEAGLPPLPPRSPLARAWRRLGKPVYHFVTRRLLRTRDGEERRSSRGPWPRWDPPLG